MKISRCGNTVMIQYEYEQSTEKVEKKYKNIASYNKRAIAWCKKRGRIHD